MADEKLGTTFNGEKKARKSPQEKIADLQKKQDQLQAKIKNEKAKLTSEKRKMDTRRKIVAGAIALEHMEHDENFKNVMEGLLKRHLKDADRQLFEF